jgi:ABC-type nitrate/sulfonate/bicarbonate transport system substrate-binding protein
MLWNGQPVWILAALSLSDRYVGLVAPPEIERFEQLYGKRIGVTRGTTTELFIRAMLQGAGVLSTAVTFIDLQQYEMADALAHAHIDVASTAELFRLQTIAALPGAHVLYADGTFLDYWLLVASSDFVVAQPDTVRRVLSALVKAIAYIQQHPHETQRIVLRYLPNVQPRPWTVYDFSLRLDSVFANGLTTNARLLYSDRPGLPDFQRFFYYQGLQAVLPPAGVGVRREEGK